MGNATGARKASAARLGMSLDEYDRRERLTPAQRTRRYEARHPERTKESKRRSREKEANRQAARTREQGRRDRIRAEVIRLLGGRCLRCGFDDARALHVDHVHDDGAHDRLQFGGRRSYNTYGFFRAVIEAASSGRYQLLCANCNTIKEWERKRSTRRNDDG